jgi:hypothetical protein
MKFRIVVVCTLRKVYNQVTKWPSDQVTKWPSDQVTSEKDDEQYRTTILNGKFSKWLSDQVTMTSDQVISCTLWWL